MEDQHQPDRRDNDYGICRQRYTSVRGETLTSAEAGSVAILIATIVAIAAGLILLCRRK